MISWNVVVRNDIGEVRLYCPDCWKKAKDVVQAYEKENGYGWRKEKKVTFLDTDVRHAQLRLRLQHDGITQSDFFRALVTGYLENDSRIIRYLANYKEKHGIQNKKKRARVVEEIEQGTDLLEKFGIKNDEVEGIFDMIAEEFPDL